MEKDTTRGRAWLRRLDTHRRTVLDVLGMLLLVGGMLTLLLAVALLYPAADHRVPGPDVMSAASTSIAAGGILSGIGGPRTDPGTSPR